MISLVVWAIYGIIYDYNDYFREKVKRWKLFKITKESGEVRYVIYQNNRWYFPWLWSNTSKEFSNLQDAKEWLEERVKRREMVLSQRIKKKELIH